MSATENTPQVDNPAEATTVTNEVADVRPADMDAAISRKFAEDDEGFEANAYRKIARILAASHKGGMPAPQSLTYWMYRTITDENETQILRDQCHVAIAAAPEVNAPLIATDIAELEGMIEKLDSGETLSDADQTNLSECLRLTLKWIDVAVRTKTNRNASKGKGTKVA